MVGAVETFSDNTAALAATQRLEELDRELIEDTLTGVGNRRFLDLKLELCRFESQITGRPFGVLMVDVDRFKDINDSFGHGVGDRALRMTAETLRNGIRQSDYLGRWGGDEFLIMLTGLSEATLAELGEKMRVLVERSRLEEDGRLVGVTVSIGATMSRLEETHGDLLERVDGLLYQAKDQGRNAVHLAV
jgi:diguanylate cyclase (GGDEF)-like protein